MDVMTSTHGTICLLSPLSNRGDEWLHHNIDKSTWFGGSVAVELRYVGPILNGIVNDGLKIK